MYIFYLGLAFESWPQEGAHTFRVTPAVVLGTPPYLVFRYVVGSYLTASLFLCSSPYDI